MRYARGDPGWHIGGMEGQSSPTGFASAVVPPPAQLVGLGVAALRVGVPQKWLRAEAEAGRVPCLRAGNRFLFSVPALLADLTRRAAATPAAGEVAHA